MREVIKVNQSIIIYIRILIFIFNLDIQAHIFKIMIMQSVWSFWCLDQKLDDSPKYENSLLNLIYNGV